MTLKEVQHTWDYAEYLVTELECITCALEALNPDLLIHHRRDLRRAAGKLRDLNECVGEACDEADARDEQRYRENQER